MRCEIISTGSEIMNGTTIDTNSNYIMDNLYKIGIEVDLAISVSDDRNYMKEAIGASIDRSDLIYIIGGLGPTEDDHTKDIVSEVLNLELVLDDNILNSLKLRYKNRGLKMPENNTQQALILEESLVLENKFGTAPGVYIKNKNKKIFLLPGPPRELIPMFDNSLKYLSLNGFHNKIETINTLNIGESQLEMILKEIEIPKEIEVLTYPKDRRVDIQLKYKENINLEVLNLLKKEIENKLVNNIYGYNYKSLEEMLLDIAYKKNYKLAFAESCTGGLLASRFTDVPGASNVLNRSLVTYSKEAKMDELDVRKSTLQKYGAISSETAIEMAQGIREKSKVDIGLSIIGVAGPGKEEDKSEGLIYIGVSTEANTYSVKHEFSGSRKVIKSLAASQAFIEAIKLIKVD